jgi:hypothetical protein
MTSRINRADRLALLAGRWVDGLRPGDTERNAGATVEPAGMIRRTAAVLVALHGVIHLIGFLAPWRIVTLQSLAYRTSVLGGGLDIGDVGVRVIGLVWLGLTVGFLAAGFAIWRGKPRAIGLTGVLAVVSLIVCVVGLPETGAGGAIDVAILAMVSYVAFNKSRSLGPTGRSMP